MPLSFLPYAMTDSVTDLLPSWLHKRNIRLLMLDFDNTIVPYVTNTPTGTMEAWLHTMLTSQIRICVVSNSKKDRVKFFCQEHGVDCITHARKPFSKGIRQCLERYQLSGAMCALAGDQIFTDTLGANCAGVTSILVKPINNHNFWLKARHVLEQPFIYLARKRRL